MLFIYFYFSICYFVFGFWCVMSSDHDEHDDNDDDADENDDGSYCSNRLR